MTVEEFNELWLFEFSQIDFNDPLAILILEEDEDENNTTYFERK
jgi:hypothetical protein